MVLTLDTNWYSVENEADFKPTLVSLETKHLPKKYGLLVSEVPTRYHNTLYFV
jgi:peptidyl-dipeptidase Dcp